MTSSNISGSSPLVNLCELYFSSKDCSLLFSEVNFFRRRVRCFDESNSTVLQISELKLTKQDEKWVSNY